MKRALFLTVILLLAAPVAYVMAGRQVDSQKEDIVIVESTLYGDVQAAEGLCLEIFATDFASGGHLLWDISYPLGSGKPRSTFSYSLRGGTTMHLARTNRIKMWIPGSWGTVQTNGPSAPFLPQGHSMAEVVKAVMERTVAGERRTETVQLADYYEYYPLFFEVESNSPVIPDSSAGSKLLHVYYDDDRFSPLFDARYFDIVGDDQGYFTDFFRIPVSEESTYSITLEKGEDGGVIDCQVSFLTGPTIENLGAFGREGVYHAWYLTPSENGYPMSTEGEFSAAHTEADRVDIEAEDPGENYGIFYYPYVESPVGYRYLANLTIDPIQAVKVCDLEPGIQLADMALDESEDRLYLVRVEGEDTYLGVYEVTGTERKLIQKLLIDTASASEVQEAPTDLRLSVKEEGVLITWHDGSFALAICEDQEMTLWCPRQETALEPVYFRYENFWDFDGERLALASFVYGQEDCINLAVYTKEGLAWYGLCEMEKDMEEEILGVKWE